MMRSRVLVGVVLAGALLVFGVCQPRYRRVSILGSDFDIISFRVERKSLGASRPRDSVAIVINSYARARTGPAQFAEAESVAALASRASDSLRIPSLFVQQT